MLVSCHIGAPGGDRRRPVLEKIDNIITSTLIDADLESIEKLKEKRGSKNSGSGCNCFFARTLGSDCKSERSQR